MSFSVTYQGKPLPLPALPLETTTLAELAQQLQELTDIPPDIQKLVYKGKNPSAVAVPEETTLEQAGIKEGVKIMLLGTPVAELGRFKKEEKDAEYRAEVMARRAASAPTKVRKTGPSSVTLTYATATYKFGSIVPLPHLPQPEEARKILTKLAHDPAILHLMNQHTFTVGTLTELAPHEHPNLLGLNQNGGEVVKLRVRTDAYDGFRSYAEIRRVALHELTHNVWGAHDDNFKTLNSQLNREVAEYEAGVKGGSHALGGDVYGGYEGGEEDVMVGGMIGGSNVLGAGPSTGASGSVGSVLLTQEERRARAVEAAMKRLQEHEGEMEDRCAS